MAYQKTKAKAGMEGRTTQTERWGPRQVVKYAARKQRRKESKKVVAEQQGDDSRW